MKKFLIAAAALITAGAPMAASAAPFGDDHDVRPASVQNRWDGERGSDHRWGGGNNYGYGYGRYGYGYGRGYYGGGAAAAGLFGLFLGAALASEQPYYAPCHWETRTFVGPWGGVHYQQVEVCR